VTGTTYSADFPTQNSLQPQEAGQQDIFVTKLSPSGSSLVDSTYLGGNNDDYGYSIAVDRNGNTYVAGTARSTDFPMSNALQRKFGGNSDTFVSEVNAGGTTLVYSSYLGGSTFDQAQGITVDGTGNAYVTGTPMATSRPRPAHSNGE
jgi:hypothetical protein